MKLLITGKSATEKETVADILEQKYGYKTTFHQTTINKNAIEQSKVIILAPSAVETICGNFPDEAFYLLNITADEGTRLKVLNKRPPNIVDEAINDNDEEFIKLEEQIQQDGTKWKIRNLVAAASMQNEYTEESMEKLVQFSRNAINRHENIKQIIRELTDNGTFHTDDKGNLLVQDTTGSNTVTAVPEDLFAAISLSSIENCSIIFDWWLTTHNN